MKTFFSIAHFHILTLIQHRERQWELYIIRETLKLPCRRLNHKFVNQLPDFRCLCYLCVPRSSNFISENFCIFRQCLSSAYEDIGKANRPYHSNPSGVVCTVLNGLKTGRG